MVWRARLLGRVARLYSVPVEGGIEVMLGRGRGCFFTEEAVWCSVCFSRVVLSHTVVSAFG